MSEKRDLQADGQVAFAIMQEATERLVEFMTPLEAVECITAFGVMSVLELGGYEQMSETVFKAATQGFKGQIARRMMGPS